MTALAAMAASTALPPSSRMWAPACEARNCGVETIPNFETTIDRPCPGTDANCCAGATMEPKSNMARDGKCFISPLEWNTVEINMSPGDSSSACNVSVREHYSTAAQCAR